MISNDTYLASLREKLTGQFDLLPPPVETLFPCSLYGYMNIQNKKYMLTHKAKIWGYENDEHIFAAFSEKTSIETLKTYTESLKKKIGQIVKLHDEHMSSQITLLIITENPISEEVRKFVSKYRWQKGFFFGLKGWADLVITVVSPHHNEVVTYKKNSKTAGFFLETSPAAAASEENNQRKETGPVEAQ